MSDADETRTQDKCFWRGVAATAVVTLAAVTAILGIAIGGGFEPQGTCELQEGFRGSSFCGVQTAPGVLEWECPGLCCKLVHGDGEAKMQQLLVVCGERPAPRPTFEACMEEVEKRIAEQTSEDSTVDQRLAVSKAVLLELADDVTCPKLEAYEDGPTKVVK